MKKIMVNDVRTVLANMKNANVSTLTDEELSYAILQDDLGMEDYEIVELVQELEKVGHFFIVDPAVNFLKKQQSVSVELLRRICNEYAVETKPYNS